MRLSLWRRYRGPRYRKGVGTQVWHGLRTAFFFFKYRVGVQIPKALSGKGQKKATRWGVAAAWKYRPNLAGR
ncbi:MAG: hypothetical protein PHX60_13585 [Giesbergeria sp.]|uniref:hypothetical protein n=1 Tax=Giesbergeria sp. TaxID=2818473 RepID=UPI002616AF2F|nr:hypothetical protein [Giesbergeria sp.]MDD2610692.1 hypothetical protein [Giesbergeria sp.]